MRLPWPHSPACSITHSRYSGTDQWTTGMGGSTDQGERGAGNDNKTAVLSIGSRQKGWTSKISRKGPEMMLLEKWI